MIGNARGCYGLERSDGAGEALQAPASGNRKRHDPCRGLNGATAITAGTFETCSLRPEPEGWQPGSVHAAFGRSNTTATHCAEADGAGITHVTAHLPFGEISAGGETSQSP